MGELLFTSIYNQCLTIEHTATTAIGQAAEVQVPILKCHENVHVLIVGIDLKNTISITGHKGKGRNHRITTGSTIETTNNFMSGILNLGKTTENMTLRIQDWPTGIMAEGISRGIRHL